MLTPDLLAFVRSSLPPPPARILEIGAGQGELAAALTSAGYAVTAIDPAAEPGGMVERVALIDARGLFDAAVAVVSLHHIEPLEESCAHLATLVGPGGLLVVDELDVECCDERAVRWWLAQRGVEDAPHRGEHPPSDDPEEILRDLRSHIHPLTRVSAALRSHFELGEPVRGPYLHRWELRASLQPVEVELIAEGRLPAIGARMIGVRRAVAPGPAV